MDITAVVTEAEGQILVAADLTLVRGESHRVAGPAERPAGRREGNHAKSRSDQRSCGLVAWRGRPGLDRRSVPSGPTQHCRIQDADLRCAVQSVHSDPSQPGP